MKHDFSDKNVLITGAGRGLGRHAALHLALSGATVGVVDIDGDNSAATAAAIDDADGTAFAYSGDVSDPELYEEVVADFAGRCGRIDAVINNAMILHYSPVEDVDPNRLDAMLSVGVKALFWSARSLLRHYDPEIGACMINIASPVAVRGYAGTSAYSTVKGAVVSFTRVMAAELGPRNIRVNAVSPGSVPTPGALALNAAEVYERRAAVNPLRRNGTEEDNSKAIAFLLSSDADYINGEILNVDGGTAACA
ncbi:MAG: SDR family oxidoreductase [Gammaproteobacteria bacterium]|jgi:NAD(P)-dependent dehydrogenase (short-subunit alcohol dehydrogenase family)